MDPTVKPLSTLSACLITLFAAAPYIEALLWVFLFAAVLDIFGV